MANEITVPLLPCRSIDEMAEFYAMLGFTRTYYQTRPNPYVSLEREDLRLDFFGMPDFDPADSYGTCLVIVPDTRELFDAFAAGMRAVHGKLLVSGIPRMTRPRKRKNADNHSGFTVIDPGGNWIRIVAAAPEAERSSGGKLSVTLARAVVMGDSHGKHVRAAQILDAALERDKATATAAELVETLAYRAELAIRADDTEAAVAALARAREIPLTEAERATLTESLAALDDIELGLRAALQH
ncbi:VOC family protein [Nocardia cyriacigeorgica]|uniref:VOC family protein n=1 Tax=Nocardia cyriacigeorgica TaxID=135487 RepID=A0A5R8NM05_9NOCA|nr:VOC family protein [Nocardia cyriacigeorgica]TLF76706.1 VOC family protein [Nocardia cyriacigeorgica]